MDLFDEAVAHDKAGRFSEAERLYDMLLSQNHDNPGLLATMGTLYLKTQKYGLAISLMERALKSSPNMTELLSNLSLAYKQSGQRDKCMVYAERSIKHNPTAEALSNYAGLYTQTGSPEKAIKYCSMAIEKNPDLKIAHWNLALACLESGQWERGWKEHEWGLTDAPDPLKSPMRVDRHFGDLPNWDGTPNKTVIVYGEQGLGDEIMFGSMLPDILKTNPVVIESHKRLKPLFETAFPGVPVYGTREDTEINWPFNHNAEYRLSMGSLGKFYRNKLEDFPGTPYLKAETAPRGEKFRLGISWTGGQKAGRVLVRTVPLSWWKKILDHDIEVVSLQYTECSEEIALMNKQGFDIKEFTEVKADDYYETAKLVMSCDLVISITTSVVHLAGALGVPCWVMVPNKPTWPFQVSGKMPWWKSLKLYRQPQGDSWIPVVEKVAEDFEQLLSEKQLRVA